MELNVEQVDEDINVVGSDHDEAKHKVVAEAFHDSDDYFAADGYSTVDNLKYNGDVLGNNGSSTESCKVDGVRRVRNKILFKDRVLVEMPLGHKALLGAPCISESSALDFGTILKNKGAGYYTIRMESTVKEVQSRDLLESFVEFIAATDTIGDDEVIIMVC